MRMCFITCFIFVTRCSATKFGSASPPLFSGACRVASGWCQHRPRRGSSVVVTLLVSLLKNFSGRIGPWKTYCLPGTWTALRARWISRRLSLLPHILCPNCLVVLVKCFSASFVLPFAAVCRPSDFCPCVVVSCVSWTGLVVSSKYCCIIVGLVGSVGAFIPDSCSSSWRVCMVAEVVFMVLIRFFISVCSCGVR